MYLCGLSDNRYSARVMPNLDFFPGKEDKRNFVCVLEFMLAIDEMQKTSPLICTKVEI